MSEWREDGEPPFIPQNQTISSEVSASVGKLQEVVETGNEHNDFVAPIEISKRVFEEARSRPCVAGGLIRVFHTKSLFS